MGAWVPVSPRATWATTGVRERAQIPFARPCAAARYRCRAYITYAPPGVFLPFL